jgi:hypothetical protein
LEEENVTLSEKISDMKNQLAEAKRDAAASKLIPHCRLVVIRAKTHGDNLAQQIQRERQVSQSLREQLSETYNDLKKVVEEKRQLYKRLGKVPLADDERILRKLGAQMSLETKPSRSSSPGSLRARSNTGRVPSSDYASFGDIVD